MVASKMKENELFIQYVKKILNELDDEFVESFDKNKYFKMVMSHQKFLLLPHSVSEEYAGALNLLKGKAESSDRPISDERIERIFEDFLLKMHHLNDARGVLTKEAQDLFDSIRRANTSKYLTIVPLINIQTLVDFKLGHVLITNLNSEKITSIQSEYGIRFHVDDIHNFNQRIMKTSAYPTVSITVVESSDYTKARDLAIQKTDQLLNVLRLFVPNFKGLITGEALEQVDRTILITDIQTNASQAHGERCNMKIPFDDVIGAETISTFFKKYTLNKDHLNTIHSMLIKSLNELSPLQRDILTAIYWIGNSVKSSSRTDKFVKYIITLDTLLAQGRNDKRETVAKRFTAIMHNHSQNEEIMRAYNEIKGYYRLRNDIMHSGFSEVEEEVFNQLQHRVHDIVQTLLEYCHTYANIQVYPPAAHHSPTHSCLPFSLS